MSWPEAIVMTTIVLSAPLTLWVISRGGRR